MAQWDLAVTAVEARFRTAWAGHTPVLFEGGADADGKPFSAPNGPWVFVHVRWNGAENASVDGALKRRFGQVWVHAFIPANRVGREAHQLAARAATVFEDADFAGVRCFEAKPAGEADAAVANMPDGRWQGQSACIPFEFDETKL